MKNNSAGRMPSFQNDVPTAEISIGSIFIGSIEATPCIYFYLIYYGNRYSDIVREREREEKPPKPPEI